jgi:hypothetical protein
VYCVWFAPDPAAFTFDFWFSMKVESAWTTPVNISRAHATSNVGNNSTIAVGPDGRVHVAYDLMLQGQPDIYYTAQSGDTWLTPVLVSQTPSDEAFPTLVSDVRGDLHLCWRLRGDSGYVMYSRRDTAWSVPVRIASAPGAVVDENLAAGADGRVHLVYVGYPNNSSSDVFYMVLAGDTWSAPENVSQCYPHYAEYSTVSVDSGGHVYIGWVQDDGAYQWDLKYRYLTDGWSPVYALTDDPGHDSYGPRFVETASNRGADIFWPYYAQTEQAAFAPYAVYYMKLSPVGQGIAEDTRVTPNGGGISAAPNPFSTTVEFTFSVAMERRDVRVYSATGALVRRLAVQPGQVSVAWDGRTADGLEAPAGVYTVVVGDGAGRSSLRVVRMR